jgi:hypothetical protein
MKYVCMIDCSAEVILYLLRFLCQFLSTIVPVHLFHAGESTAEKRKERSEEKGATLPSAHRAGSANNSAAVRKVYETDII